MLLILVQGLMKLPNLSTPPDTHLVEAKGPDELLVHLIAARLGERVLLVRDSQSFTFVNPFDICQPII